MLTLAMDLPSSMSESSPWLISNKVDMKFVRVSESGR